MTPSPGWLPVPEVLRGQALAVINVEGSCGGYGAEIIETAVLRIDPETAGTDPSQVQAWLSRPRRGIDPMSTHQAHSLTAAELAGQPPFAEIAGEIAVLLRDRVLVAHHASTEQCLLSRHLGEQWAPTSVLDTLLVASTLWGPLDNYRLPALAEYAGVETTAAPGRPRRAAWDAWVTWALLCRQLTSSGYTWPELLRAGRLDTLQGQGASLW